MVTGGVGQRAWDNGHASCVPGRCGRVLTAVGVGVWLRSFDRPGVSLSSFDLVIEQGRPMESTTVLPLSPVLQAKPTCAQPR